MVRSYGYAAMSAKGRLAPFSFERRDPGPHDVVLEIKYCGICHTDLNAVEDAYGWQAYPVVPGHEIVGKVVAVGDQVKKLKPGDWAGVGTIVDSCRKCGPCCQGLEPHCEEGMTPTYGAPDRQGRMTFGGYANNYVVDEHFALVVPEGLDPAGAAPLLCAGITTFSPLRRAGVGPGHKVGVIGLGGLGHVAVKFAAALGAKVVVFSTSPGKTEDAKRLGAEAAVLSTDAEAMAAHRGSFDFIIDTVSGTHELNPYIELLKLNGTVCLVGMPTTMPLVSPMLLAMGRRVVTGSMIGGLAETQEMLDFAAGAGIAADVEMIRMDQVDEAFARLAKGDVRYRFVIDMDSLKAPA
ncbi:MULTISPECIES: NAD(P)-dependent alcohol dehydrogenase [unclassified Phenylobacterium]|uniref:NAD(P)-dependent alcohol dehydrogenase n=1 Tax=unclassified Phenylobacterium TaxID=2640670 RepID=UPI000AE4F46E|nr:MULTISPECIES: NAD(P)-dependent alcohol dehydrogenase [unclassified Phenylobacterium]